MSDSTGLPPQDGSRGKPLRSLARRLNEQAVLHTIFHQGPLTRSRVATLTGLSKPTVSSIVDDLVEADVVQETGRTSGGVGRTATLYQVDGRTAYVIGIDLGGTKINAAAADLYGEVVAERTERTDSTSADALIAQLRTLSRDVAEEGGVGWDRMRAITIGVPGTVDPESGEIRLASNIPDLSGHALAHEIKGDWGVEVILENDINLAAVGERWQGLAKDCDNFVVISIGTGVGAGLVINGEVYSGAGGAAGEIPFLPLGEDPFDPAMHRRGPLEEAVAGSGIVGQVATRLAQGEPSSLSPGSTAAEVFAAAGAGDDLAHSVIDNEARQVALAIVSVAAVLAPELVVLGGGVGANPLLLEPVRRYSEQLLPLPLSIERSALAGRASLLGAIALGLQEARAHILSPAGGDVDALALAPGPASGS
jgi:predicted NBD/HSP70 family sugar kinase